MHRWYIVTSDHPLPEGKRHSLWVRISEPGPTLLLEYSATDLHYSMLRHIAIAERNFDCQFT
jgi:hypothetical protein